MCGTIARLLNTLESGRSKSSAILADLFVSGFMGLLLYWAPFERGLAFAFAGIAGWVGPRLLDMVVAGAAKKAGVDTPKPTIDRDNEYSTEPQKPPGIDYGRRGRREHDGVG
jgi:hypothetical protein